MNEPFWGWQEERSAKPQQDDDDAKISPLLQLCLLSSDWSGAEDTRPSLAGSGANSKPWKLAEILQVLCHNGERIETGARKVKTVGGYCCEWKLMII